MCFICGTTNNAFYLLFPVGVVWSLIGIAAGWLLKNFTFETVKYVAFRALLIILVLSLGPIMIFKGYSMVIRYMIDYASTYMDGEGLSGAVVTMTGLAAYLGNLLRVGEALSIILSFSLVGLVLRILRLK